MTAPIDVPFVSSDQLTNVLLESMRALIEIDTDMMARQSERVSRLEFLLASAETQAQSHLQQRLRAEEALQDLSRGSTNRDLQARVTRLEAQLRNCELAASGQKPSNQVLATGDYGWSPALEAVVALHRAATSLMTGEPIPDDPGHSYFQDGVGNDRIPGWQQVKP